MSLKKSISWKKRFKINSKLLLYNTLSSISIMFSRSRLANFYSIHISRSRKPIFTGKLYLFISIYAYFNIEDFFIITFWTKINFMPIMYCSLCYCTFQFEINALLEIIREKKCHPRFTSYGSLILHHCYKPFKILIENKRKVGV